MINGIFARGGAFLGPRRRHPRSLAFHLAKVRRPGRISQSRGLILGRQLQQRFQRTRGEIHARVRIAHLCESPGHGQHRKIRRLAIWHLVPKKRRGNAGIRQRPHRIRRARCPILGVLVVVEEYAVAFLFPPFRTGQCGHTPLHRPRQRQRCAAHFAKSPARFDAHIHMHAARAAGLGPTAKPELFEERLHFKRDSAHIFPVNAGARIEIHAQLVGVIKIGGANRMRMQLDAAQVHDPGQPSRIVDHDFFRGAAGRKGQRHRPHPRGPIGGRALLIKGFRFRAVHETFQNDRAIADAGQRARRDRQVVAHQVESSTASSAGKNTACPGWVTRTS